ncbi:MAG: phospholipase D-like domain-containing protein [Candidatus Saliniplasma sp.]
MKKVAAVILILLFIIPQPVVGDAEPDIKITEVYYKSRPGGEYIVLSNKGGAGTIEELMITDLEGDLIIENVYFGASEEIVIAADESDYKDIWHDDPDLIMYEDFDTEGNFKLANEEDELLIYTGGELSDAFYYGEGEGDEGYGWIGERCAALGYASYAKRRAQDTNSAEDWNWSRDWKVGHSDFDQRRFSYNGNLTAFCSPDNSHEVIMGFLDDVELSLKISIYELGNKKITNRIAELAEEGVQVNILAEGNPVGGLSEEARLCLSKIKDSGGDVQLMGDFGYSPYHYLHSKMMVADSKKVLISSENFGYNGYPVNPTYGNRGWGVVLEDKEISGYYTQVFQDDMQFGDDFIASDIEDFDNIQNNQVGFHSKSFEPFEMEDKLDVEAVISPDTSKESITDMIESADDSIYLQQFYIRPWENGENPFVSSIIERAKEGVEVKILLDSTWYNLGDYSTIGNDDIVEKLRNISEEKDIDLEAKLISDEHGLSKVHNKGMIVDEEKVLVSSVNWNSNSVLQNREVGAIIENEEIGEYFSNIFLSDWRNDITAPIADAGRDIETSENSLVELRADNSWDDDNITVYRWDVNADGNYDGEGVRYSTVFREAGSYQVMLYVEDKDGNWDTDTVTILVEEEEDTWMDRDGETSLLPMVFLIILLSISAMIAFWRYQ